MRIDLSSVLVDDQEKALRFYTDILGFVKKNDIPLGEHRWLTVSAFAQNRRVSTPRLSNEELSSGRYHWLALYLRHPHVNLYRQAVACPMLPQKRKRAEVFTHHHKRAALVPSAGTISQKD